MNQNKTIIIDETFSKDKFFNFQQTIKNLNNLNKDESWYDLDQEHEFSMICNDLLNECSKYYDVSSCIGYEFWTQNNSRPANWHYDKDETHYQLTNEYRFPICSIVYYPIVNNLIGGKLHIKTDVITPCENRMIIFPPGSFHYVEEFEGNRCSVLVNPWDYNISLGMT
jgi:hypothetical protein